MGCLFVTFATGEMIVEAPIGQVPERKVALLLEQAIMRH